MSQGPQERGKIKAANRPYSKIKTKVKDTLAIEGNLAWVSFLQLENGRSVERKEKSLNIMMDAWSGSECNSFAWRSISGEKSIVPVDG